MQQLATFQSYAVAEDAYAVAALLAEAGIVAEVVKRTGQPLAVYTGAEYADQYELQLATTDFKQANELLYSGKAADVSQLDSNHPLYNLTDKELLEIIGKPDEWGPDNYNVAVALLKSRGTNITDEYLARLRAERTGKLAVKKNFSSTLIVLAYAMGVVPYLQNLSLAHSRGNGVAWYFPGFFGILVGLIITRSTTTLPDGSQVATYDAPTVNHGRNIIILNVVCWVVSLMLMVVEKGS